VHQVEDSAAQGAGMKHCLPQMGHPFELERYPYDQKIGTRLFLGGYRILIRFVLMPARVMK
jgi:hypothetical protein